MALFLLTSVELIFDPRIKNVVVKDIVKTPESISETSERLHVPDGSMPTISRWSTH